MPTTRFDFSTHIINQTLTYAICLFVFRSHVITEFTGLLFPKNYRPRMRVNLQKSPPQPGCAVSDLGATNSSNPWFVEIPTSTRLRRIGPGRDKFVQSLIRTPACSGPLSTSVQLHLCRSGYVWLHMYPVLHVSASMPVEGNLWIPVFSIFTQSCANIS